MPEYCVTGGTGFIAAYLVKALLGEGHTVRATVRDPGDTAKVGFLWALAGAAERLKLVRADLTVDGSFDAAVAGADGVFHTAGPVLVSGDGNIQAALVEPCVKGAANVLSACAKANSVKRVVLTSSCSAIRYRDDAAALWYAFAKTLAEREAWRVAAERGVDLIVVNPSFVVGPLLAPQPTSTLLVILSIVKGERVPNATIGFVHVDDVVAGHLLAMESGGAAGRLVCSGEVAGWSEVVEMLRKEYPSYPSPPSSVSVLSLSYLTYILSDDRTGDDISHSMDTAKIRALGLAQFRTIPQMFGDCIRSFQEKGFL
ncbi:unnamed protein product [Spirodela intermedia]|uniref:NAD-dependent epimerase/dehydratase domain-containing protein n=1 Tax=Spirodela intermedia TaxID=51605 RepID=A0A7I8JTS4_SPIIN|nr:unnamed protein product [Spirodela intermedia]CAA6673175.1 unnamed protein product [Spirodela intermedia]